MITMARRITAALGIVATVGLLLLFLWTVYRHHERSVPPDEPAMVALPLRPA
jgi:hypothetical protein